MKQLITVKNYICHPAASTTKSLGVCGWTSEADKDRQIPTTQLRIEPADWSMYLQVQDLYERHTGTLTYMRVVLQVSC